MEGSCYLPIMRTHQKMETVPCEGCPTRWLGMLEVCCPVDLGKSEVSADPACWFNVQAPCEEVAAQREQLLVSPRIRRAVSAHIEQGRLVSSPVVVDVGRMEGMSLLPGLTS